MRQCLFIITSLFLVWSSDLRAQEPQQFSSLPPKWQLTLEGIKSKTKSLIIENNGLQNEYQYLTQQVGQLQQLIYNQQEKNERMDHFVKERDRRTNQQLRIDDLTQVIKTKSQRARIYDQQVENLKRKLSNLERKVRLLKYTVSDKELHQQAEIGKAQTFDIAPPPQSADLLDQLRKQLEDGNKQEVLLENELGALKMGTKTQNLNVDALESENKQLEAHLNVLRLQKLQHGKQASDTQLSQASARMYNQLSKRKELLEAKIYAYELRMDELKRNSLSELSWPVKKKKLVHEMVQLDAHNNQVRDKIKVLHEDIDVLKDQVARLERRINFARGKDVTLRSDP